MLNLRFSVIETLQAGFTDEAEPGPKLKCHLSCFNSKPLTETRLRPEEYSSVNESAPPPRHINTPGDSCRGGGVAPFGNQLY